MPSINEQFSEGEKRKLGRIVYCINTATIVVLLLLWSSVLSQATALLVIGRGRGDAYQIIDAIQRELIVLDQHSYYGSNATVE